MKMKHHAHVQAMAKRITKAERTNQLVIYCVERDRAAIANASFLLAAYLLIVVGKTAAQAAERFTGPSVPYILAPFRDASFCSQVELRGDGGRNLSIFSHVVAHDLLHLNNLADAPWRARDLYC